MNKAELEKKVKSLEKRLKEEKHSNNFLLRQQNELKKMAEKAGSEVAVWKHKYLRLEELYKKFKV